MYSTVTNNGYDVTMKKKKHLLCETIYDMISASDYTEDEPPRPMSMLHVILRILKPGDEVIAGDDLYGGTNRILSYLQTHVGVKVHHVDTTDPSSVIPFINPGKTAMVLLESPTNPLLKIVDLATISKDVKRAPLMQSWLLTIL
jgi:hypothetical protein